MYLIHYYLQRGIPAEQILRLTPVQKLFYEASMMLAMEERAEELGG